MSRFLRISLIIGLFASNILFAHQRSESFSKWIIEENVETKDVSIIFTVKISVLNKMDWPFDLKTEDYITKYISESIDVGPNCTSKKRPVFFISKINNFIKISWILECLKQPLEISINSFFEKDSTHSHIARFQVDNKPIPEKLFTNQSRSWKEVSDSYMRNKVYEGSSIGDYVTLGIKHIASGYDHLAFLIGLLLLNVRLKGIFLAVTGFTLGHSVTLAAAVLGLVKPVSSFVEALIGYSIFLVAIEYFLRKTNQFTFYLFLIFLGWSSLILSAYFLNLQLYFLGLIGTAIFTLTYLSLVARTSSRNISYFVICLFGLIHGFGFGGYLSEIGLQDDRITQALLGFNIGVELGQILAVLLFLLLGNIIRRVKLRNIWLVKPLLASSLISLGVYWFLTRTF
ncbi:uncharacterized protein METZ01_LOCUS100961 [marine metagenome]|uniref:HupE/UreJ protein n=1 Tax=marine metagenome TaxID=408172 RepID=A0A381W832_9ZZZZ